MGFLGVFLFFISLGVHADTVALGGNDIERNACIESTNAARAWVREILGDGIPWLDARVECDVASERGCGSQMSGRYLEFFSGDDRCVPAVQIPSLVYHEWAHGLNHELAGIRWDVMDEAMADTFAAFLSGDPRIGRGIYIGRERTWYRDLSERKIYDGPTKGRYTQSLTLSGAWWDFRVRVGAELAREVFLKHLALMGTEHENPNIENDYYYARTVVPQASACALSNAFLDHGYGELASGCDRAPLKTDEEAILEGKERAITSTLVRGALPEAISAQTIATLRFRVNAPATMKVAALILGLDVDHAFPDDLLFRVVAPDGRTWHDVYKGEEEIRIPALITDRYKFRGLPARGIWTLEVLSFETKPMGGKLRQATLSVLPQ